MTLEVGFADQMGIKSYGVLSSILSISQGLLYYKKFSLLPLSRYRESLL